MKTYTLILCLHVNICISVADRVFYNFCVLLHADSSATTSVNTLICLLTLMTYFSDIFHEP